MGIIITKSIGKIRPHGNGFCLYLEKDVLNILELQDGTEVVLSTETSKKGKFLAVYKA